jgi:hypothetical protein
MARSATVTVAPRRVTSNLTARTLFMDAANTHARRWSSAGVT